MKSNFKDGSHNLPKSNSTAGSEKAPGTPSQGAGSSSGAGINVKQVESLPTSGSGKNSKFDDPLK